MGKDTFFGTFFIRYFNKFFAFFFFGTEFALLKDNSRKKRKLNKRIKEKFR